MAAELTVGAAELAEGAADLQSPWSSSQDVPLHVSHLHSPHPLSRPIPSALDVSLLSGARALVRALDLTCRDDCTDTDSDVGSSGGVEVKDVVGAEGCGTDGWAETAGHVGGAESPCRSGTSRSSRLSPGGQAVWHFDISKGDLDDEEQDYCPSGVCTPRTPRRSSASRSIACDQLSPPKLTPAGFLDQLKLQELVKQTDFVAVPVWPLCVVVELPADFNRRTFPADNALLEPRTVEFCDMPPLEPHVFETCEMPSLEPHRSDICDLPPLEPHMFETSSEYRVVDAASRAADVRDLQVSQGSVCAGGRLWTLDDVRDVFHVFHAWHSVCRLRHFLEEHVTKVSPRSMRSSRSIRSSSRSSAPNSPCSSAPRSPRSQSSPCSSAPRSPRTGSFHSHCSSSRSLVVSTCSGKLTSPWHDAMERAGPGLQSALHALATELGANSLTAASSAATLDFDAVFHAIIDLPSEQATQVQHLVVNLADKHAPTYADDGAHVVDDGARGGGAHAAGVQVVAFGARADGPHGVGDAAHAVAPHVDRAGVRRRSKKYKLEGW